MHATGLTGSNKKAVLDINTLCQLVGLGQGLVLRHSQGCGEVVGNICTCCPKC